MGSLTSDYNLIDEAWLPIRRANGRAEWIRPWEITRGVDENPLVEPAWLRPDLDLATEEFLIGLLSTAAAPDNEDEWDEWQHKPPTAERLREAFVMVAYAFNLCGDGPRFMQDMDTLEKAEGKPVAALLVDTPGEQTKKKNTDLFVHRDHVPQVLGCPAAAIVLFTQQAYAPKGGSGHRTSLRGGGPMTTLLRTEGLPYSDTLWGRVWPNVETKEQQYGRAVGDSLNQPIFPWVDATRTSEKKGGVITTPADAHSLQVYWGMPRRIRLQFEAAEGRTCELTGEDAPDGVVTEYRTVNYGVNYSDGFTHPLSPYYRKRVDDPWLATHLRSPGISYRLWPDYVGMDADTTGKRPAQTVRHWHEERGGTPARLRVAGYDMDNMKPRNWVEGEMPIYHLSDSVRRERLERLALQLVEAAGLAAGQLAGQVMFAVPGSAMIRLRFDRNTEAAFYAALAQAKQALEAASDVPLGDVHEQWRETLAEAAIALFDERAPLDGGDVPKIKRRAQARKNLIFWLRGYGKGRKFFSTLELTPPKPKKRSDKE